VVRKVIRIDTRAPEPPGAQGKEDYSRDTNGRGLACPSAFGVDITDPCLLQQKTTNTPTFVRVVEVGKIKPVGGVIS